MTTPENESVMRTYGAMARDISEEHKIMLMRPKLLINPAFDSLTYTYLFIDLKLYF